MSIDRPELEGLVEALLTDGGARRSLPLDEVRSDALGWLRDWWFDKPRDPEADDLPDSLGETVALDALGYAIWHRVGPEEGEGPGFIALHRFAIRDARGDVERGTEAASETYLDVRDRLENIVSRAERGRSIADFSQPSPEVERNVHRYHAIQSRLRVRGKWSKRRAEELYEDGRHASSWEGAYRAVEARTYALPVHFASWWTLIDVRERRTRDGRVKGPAWWWQMLLHALDVSKTDELGGDRNDPTEALLRMRIRFAVSQGLTGWLRRWSADHAYWRQVDFGLPDPENLVARRAVDSALAALRPALDAAFDSIGASESEQKALRGTLIRGENVRTSTRHVAGEDAGSRQARLFALAEAAGRVAGDSLGGRDGSGRAGGGGGGRHRHADAIMARAASGEAPAVEDVVALKRAVSECSDCADRWVGVVEAPTYLRAAAAAPTTEPLVRTGLRLAPLGVVAAAAAVAAIGLYGPSDGGEVRLRGGEGAPAVHLDLFVVPDGGEHTERFVESQVYAPGDTVYFRLSADGESRVRVWVDGPEGLSDLGSQAAGPMPVELGEAGATWYRFERTGRYVFFASSGGPDGVCEAPTCVRRVVEVEP